MRIYDKERLFCWVDVETTGLGPDDVPIEVAMVVTNERLEEVARFESLIKPPSPQRFIQASTMEWLQRAREASNVHGITPEEVYAAPSDRSVIVKLLEVFDPWPRPARKDPILVSDNPVFDHRMLRTLFEMAAMTVKWPFHYNSWSPIMLTSALGAGRPQKAHRAMVDVEGMLDHVRKALDKFEAVLDLLGVHVLRHFDPSLVPEQVRTEIGEMIIGFLTPSAPAPELVSGANHPRMEAEEVSGTGKEVDFAGSSFMLPVDAPDMNRPEIETDSSDDDAVQDSSAIED